ncbi:MAG: recombination protein RecR [Caldilineaceae bacterium]|nr:recombination protein RecR [Caldilineaceae bacterium]MCB9138256.1 recombination protein RecR [Caldilineaceae bacterium]
MQPLAEPVSQLIDAFSQLPGIGPKTASRLAYYLLRADDAVALNLAHALEALKANTLFCSVCHNIADRDPCPICTSDQRDHGTLCVVEEPLDVQAIERTREYQGVYHVLHGSISPVDGVGPDDLKIAELLQRIREAESDSVADRPTAPVKEILLATNPNLEGEATAMYIARLIKPLGIRVTRLARGLPVGGDLEYADEVTLGRALAGRSEM